MSHVHKRLTDEQVAFVLRQYQAGVLSRASAQQALGVGKTRFFALLQEYRQRPAVFSVAYHRSAPTRLSADREFAIQRELERERALVEDPDLPISGYNYSAVQSQLEGQGVAVSLTTIINRAKRLGCYRGHRRRKAHDREVATTATGALIQHDSSTHLWSPFAESKWVLLASIDDYSRMLLYAEFFPTESTWVHIQAVRSLVETYGLPLSYYVDSLRIFRFVQHGDSVWHRQIARTDDVDPQWKQMMRLLGIGVEHALSPQAKGKIERPFGWLQDRIVRTCALEHLSTIDEGRAVLRAELDRYNTHQVHSTTKEIPAIRFQKARALGNCLFRPYSLPRPYTSPDDVFCLRETRVIDSYRRIHIANQVIDVPGAPLHDQVELHLVPDPDKQVMRIRIWHESKLIRTVARPLKDFGVHF